MSDLFVIVPGGDVFLIFDEELFDDSNVDVTSEGGNVDVPDEGDNVEVPDEGGNASVDSGHETDVDQISENGSQTAGKKALRVSSTHLTLSSRVFKAMLKIHPTKEAQSLQTQKSVEIPLPEDDYGAFLTVMRIIHAQHADRDDDICSLSRIATVVDKYEFHIPMRYYMENCMRTLADKSEPLYLDMLKHWLWVTWVFQDSYEFQRISKIAILEDKGPLDIDGTSLPDRIAGKLSSLRPTLSGANSFLQMPSTAVAWKQ